jgi:uncharacterized membrane protein
VSFPTRAAGLGLVLACLAVTLAGALLVKGPCASGAWTNGSQYTRLCYSDIVPLYTSEHLEGNRLPYLDACPTDQTCDEYPVVTMYAMRLAAWPADGYGGFFAANAFLLTAAAVVVVVMLYLIVGVRAFAFAVAPTLLAYAYMNWDLLAVALATAATAAFLRRRNVAAGVLLGLGAAAKLYPALLVIPFAADRLKGRDPDGAIHLTWAAVGAWVAVNLPFAIAAPAGWSEFFRFNAKRGADWDSLWFIGCDRLSTSGNCTPLGTLNLLSSAALVAGVVAIWLLRRSRDPGFARWTLGFPIIVLFLLTNKVFSPQYTVWLLPWFVLAFPGLGSTSWFGLFALFEATDIAVFVTRFSWFARYDQLQAGATGHLLGVPIGAFDIAVLLRAAVLVLALVAWVRQRPSESAVDAADTAPRERALVGSPA